MNQADRDRFDQLLKDVLAELPHALAETLEHIPVIIEDRPDPRLIDELDYESQDPVESDDLLGLHTGHALTEKGIEDSGQLPTVIHLFREPIVDHCGGWDAEDAENAIYEEIRITLLHEIGHHFGLDEDDLDRLGYS